MWGVLCGFGGLRYDSFSGITTATVVERESKCYAQQLTECPREVELHNYRLRAQSVAGCANKVQGKGKKCRLHKKVVAAGGSSFAEALC